jgi:cyclase
MKRIRVIPVLLLHNGGLVKSVKFKDYKYVGDPINAVKIFNEKEVDEIAILDITATAQKKKPDVSKIQEIASEAFMPMAYGGGVTTVQEIVELITKGVEKVILNYSAFHRPELVTEAAKVVGSQSVVVSMDVKKDWLGRNRVYLLNGSNKTALDPVAYAKQVEQAGAGEIVVNAIEKDGTFGGYDLELIESVSSAVSIPVIALGGAAETEDFSKAVAHGASAVAAGSMFVFQRPHRAVLISYPAQQELTDKVFSRIA